MFLHKDLFVQHIFYFLTPIELIRARTFSKLYYEWVTSFLLKNYKTSQIQDLVCPSCATWSEIKDLSMITDFYDIYDLPVAERRRHRSLSAFFNYKRSKTRRVRLLCEDCDINETYEQYEHRRLPFKGTRPYKEIFFTKEDFPWAILYIEDLKNDTIFWNEYRIGMAI